jgi:hypothetical protein
LISVHAPFRPDLFQELFDENFKIDAVVTGFIVSCSGNPLQLRQLSHRPYADVGALSEVNRRKRSRPIGIVNAGITKLRVHKAMEFR